MTGNPHVRLLPKELATAQNLTKIIGFGQIEHMARLFDDCAYHVERNANQKILFLDASIRLNKIFKKP
jgi:DNA polymerase-3 subunit delta'